MQHLFSAAEKHILRCNINYGGYISLSAAWILSQMCHWEHIMFRTHEILANFFLPPQQQAAHQHLPARILFLGARVLGEGSVSCFPLNKFKSLFLFFS